MGDLSVSVRAELARRNGFETDSRHATASSTCSAAELSALALQSEAPDKRDAVIAADTDAEEDGIALPRLARPDPTRCLFWR
jgi:hypothetical protein